MGTTIDWIPMWAFPIEWAALSLLVVGCLYWERSGYSGLGVEGCLAAAMLGLLLAYEWTGSYVLACAGAAAFAAAFGLVCGALVHLFRADPAIGTFVLSLAPVSAAGLVARADGGAMLVTASPPPGLIRGTIFDGLYAEDVILNPWFLATPLLIALAAWILWHTPYGLRLRAFGENPAWRVLGSRPTAYRISALAVGGLWTVPAAALLLRAHPEAPPIGLGFLALACTIAGRWSLLAGTTLAAGPALLLALRPYGGGTPGATAALEAAPFLLALVYMAIFSRRSLRLSASPRVDPDVL